MLRPRNISTLFLSYIFIFLVFTVLASFLDISSPFSHQKRQALTCKHSCLSSHSEDPKQTQKGCYGNLASPCWKVVCNGALFSSTVSLVQKSVLVVLAASNSYLIMLLNDIKLKFAGVAWGYKVSFVITFSCYVFQFYPILCNFKAISNEIS